MVTNTNEHLRESSGAPFILLAETVLVVHGLDFDSSLLPPAFIPQEVTPLTTVFSTGADGKEVWPVTTYSLKREWIYI